MYMDPLYETQSLPQLEAELNAAWKLPYTIPFIILGLNICMTKYNINGNTRQFAAASCTFGLEERSE